MTPCLTVCFIYLQMQSIKHNYLRYIKDPFYADAWQHPWYLAFCLTEHYLEMPFFFFAVYAYYKGNLLNYTNLYVGLVTLLLR